MRLALGPYHDAVQECVAVLGPATHRIWEHDFTFWQGDPQRHASIANRLGWLDICQSMTADVGDLAEFAASLVRHGMQDAVILGMGGSSLAPEVIARSITNRGARRRGLKVHVLDTTDPSEIRAVRNQIDLTNTLFVVASKSGTTIEAMCLFEYFYDLVSNVGLAAPGENFVAITDEGTPLQELASQRQFRRIFVNPSDIGGRYSALSYFGLVPAAIAGADVRRLLDAASAASNDAKSQTADALYIGAALGVLAQQGRDKCTFLMSPQIESFGLWVEQLIAESTGKAGKGIVPIVGEPLLGAGEYSADRCFVRMRLHGDRNASVDALAEELRLHGHPLITIELSDVYDLGREFFRWEFAVAIAGRVLDVNPFDEPNVQESKNNTTEVLREVARTGQLSLECYDVSSPKLASQLRTLVDSLDAGDYFALLSYLSPAGPASNIYLTIRETIARTRSVATMFGVGPRYLHSTGQLHKGGPPVGAFLQLVERAGDSATDIAIPGRDYTFGQLRLAQAAGDREALLKRGLPVVTVESSGEESLAQLAAILQENRQS